MIFGGTPGGFAQIEDVTSSFYIYFTGEVEQPVSLLAGETD